MSETQLEKVLTDVHADAVAMAELIWRQKQEAGMDKVILYKDQAGEWRWRREHANGNILSDSSEGYQNLADCRETALAVNGGEYVVVDD